MIFRCKRDEGMGEWRSLCNDGLDVSDGACSTYGRQEGCIQDFGGES